VVSYPGSRTHIIRLTKPTSKPRKPLKKSLSPARDTAEAGFAFLSEIVSKLLYNAARHEDASFPSHQAASWRQRARSEVKPRCPIRASRGRAMFRRSIIPIRHRSGHLTAGFFARIAEAAAATTALAPIAHRVVSSERDGGEWIHIA